MATKNLGFARAIVSSTTAPTNTKMIWYDSNPSQLKHKIYNTQTLQWEPLGGTGPEITVDDIADRDALVGVNAGQKVFVKDATNGGGGLTAKDDPDNGIVESGWALYRWDGVQYFIKIAEQESLDVTANTTGYNPTTPGDWETPNPTTVKEGLDYLAARGGVNYGRVFWVSANVAVDNVGEVGKFNKPYGIEALAAAMDTDNDVAIIMPGQYTVTNNIQGPGEEHVFYFMPGAIIDFTSDVDWLFDNASPVLGCKIFGSGKFIINGSLGIATKAQIIEFDSVEVTDDCIIPWNAAQMISVKGNIITIKSGSVLSRLNVGGYLDIQVLRSETSAYFEVLGGANVFSNGGAIKIGHIITGGDGIRINNASPTRKTKLIIGTIRCSGNAIHSVNTTTSLDMDIEIGSIIDDGNGSYAITSLGRGATVKVGNIEVSNGCNGVHLQDGKKYEIGSIIATGGGYAVYATDSTIDFDADIGYVEQNGAQWAVRLSVRRNALTGRRVRLNINHCKQVGAGFEAVYIDQVTGDSPDNNIELSGFYEAPNDVIRFNLGANWSDDTFHFMLKDCVLYAQDGIRCMYSDINPTRVMCRDAWSNAPAGSEMKLTLEGLNVSDQIIR